MFLKGRDTCQACPITCKQVFEHESDNPYQKLNPLYGGPEYEAMAAFGPSCGVEDNLAVAKANELANALGLDAISTGAAIAFVMECFEKGVLTIEDTGGLAYRWGDADLMVRSVEMIANRTGFGDVLAEGVARMSNRFGPQTELFNVTVKGQELPMQRTTHQARDGFGLRRGSRWRRPHDEYARHRLCQSERESQAGQHCFRTRNRPARSQISG